MENIAWSTDGKGVRIIDQTALPGELVYLDLYTAEEMYDAIFHLKVRGAPAIGIFAAYAAAALMDQWIENAPVKDESSFAEAMTSYCEYLNSSRPTAVNLSWALNRMMKTAESYMSSRSSVESGDMKLYDMTAILRREAEAIREEDIDMCRRISEYGLSLLNDGDGILTHCNAGPLATSHYGTGLGPLLLGKERGMEFHVFSDETRPLLQGARLTAWELSEAGIDVTLICDNMASIVMKNGWIQACLVGCDRVAANGDTANKIGTSGVAVLAKHYGIPFYVLGPTSTIDMKCETGDDICIEERNPEEIRTKFYEKPMAPEGVKCYNPAFDVTDHSLITAIITEYGICREPYTESLAEVFRMKDRRNALHGQEDTE